jgi:hypothetical protein
MLLYECMEAKAQTKPLTLFVLDLGLHVVNGVGRLHLQRDGLAGESLDEDLHATAQAQHQVQRRLLLNVVVGQRAAVLQLLAGEDEALLVRRDACKFKMMSTAQ